MYFSNIFKRCFKFWADTFYFFFCFEYINSIFDVEGWQVMKHQIEAEVLNSKCHLL